MRCLFAPVETLADLLQHVLRIGLLRVERLPHDDLALLVAERAVQVDGLCVLAIFLQQVKAAAQTMCSRFKAPRHQVCSILIQESTVVQVKAEGNQSHDQLT